MRLFVLLALVHKHVYGVEFIFAPNTACLSDIPRAFVAACAIASLHYLCTQCQTFSTDVFRYCEPHADQSLRTSKRSPRLAPQPPGPRSSTRAQPGCISRATGAAPGKRTSINGAEQAPAQVGNVAPFFCALQIQMTHAIRQARFR
jgi:hypothetical protein